MKNLLALFLAVLFALTGCGERRVAAPRVAASDFFQAISESRFQAAYESTSFAFQANTNLNSFRAASRELKLPEEGITFEWKGEEEKDGEVKLTGEISRGEAAPLSIVVRLVRERGAWRVFEMREVASAAHKSVDRFSSVGKSPELTRPSSIDPPTEAASRKLAQESLLLFNDAITRKSFSDFYTQVSSVWQSQLTEGQLQRSFQPFIDAGVNLAEVAGMEAIFDTPPEVDTQGILHLAGHYDLKTQRAAFVLRYIFEFPFWKLFGLSVEMSDLAQPAESGKAAEPAKPAEAPKPAEAAPADGAKPVPAGL